MDFSHLPDPAFLKIFEYLSLEDCVRVGGVCKSFRRFSQLAISKTKSLNLTKDRFKKINENQLGVILDLCSPKLEKISFWDGLKLATKLANYRCPRLIEIDLGGTSINLLLDGVFEQLIRNNPNIESLIWYCYWCGYNHGRFFFPNITISNLKKLGLYVYEDAVLESLIGRFPNLKELDLKMGNCCITPEVLDQFFGWVPQLDHVNLEIIRSNSKDHYNFEGDLVNFWNLPLTSLSISFPDGNFPGDSILYKVAMSFPNLKKLHFDTLSATNDGVAELADLEELEILELTIFDDDYELDDDFNEDAYVTDVFDEGIRQLAYCDKLKKLNMEQSKVTGGSLVYLLRNCPKLEHVVLKAITEVETPEEAAAILESLIGITQRDITIEFCSRGKIGIAQFRSRMANKSIWESEPVKEMIGMMEENDGLKIKLIWSDSAFLVE